MPPSSHKPSQQTRRKAILELIGTHRPKSQAGLCELLASRGIHANQATLSRDLRALGAVKGPDGYELPGESSLGHTNGTIGLWRAVKDWLLGTEVAQNQVILHTPPSAAATLASALDHGGVPQLLGTIAGDDTVLAICKDQRRAKALARELLHMRGDRR